MAGSNKIYYAHTKKGDSKMKMVKKIEIFNESTAGFCLNIPMPENSEIQNISTGINEAGEKTAFATIYVPNTEAKIVGKHIHILPVGKDFYADNVKFLGIADFKNGFAGNNEQVEFAVFEIVSGDWGYNSQEYISKFGDQAAFGNALLSLFGLAFSNADFKISGSENEIEESFGSATNENFETENDIEIDEKDFKRRFNLE